MQVTMHIMKVCIIALCAFEKIVLRLYASPVLEYTVETEGSGDENDDAAKIYRSRLQYYLYLNRIQSNKVESLGNIKKLNPGMDIFETNPRENTTFVLLSMRKKTCNADRDCGKENTCNLHNGVCERCRNQNELCRRHSNCCGDKFKCIWGRCRLDLANGEEYSQCKKDSDCKRNLCCAREHGQSVCKKYLMHGESCDIPLGGLRYSITHKCPCQPGLYCRNPKYGRLRGTCET